MCIEKHKITVIKDDFSKLFNRGEIDQYILVKGDGTIAAMQIDSPKSCAKMVLQCGINSDKTGLPRFHHISFKTDKGDAFIIFPVGSYYLGVLKKREVPSRTLLNIVNEFIKSLQLQ